MFTKQRFIEVITELQKEEDKVEKLEKLEVALTEYYRDSGFVFRCNGYSAAISDADNNKYLIKTPTELYEFIGENE